MIRQLILFSSVMAVAIGLSMGFLDLPLAIFFHGIGDTSLARIASFTTDGGLAVWYLVGAAIFFLLSRFVLHNRQVAMMAAFMFASVAASGVVTDILKVLFGRTRPKLLFSDHLFQFHWLKFGAKWNSFPSGHSTSVAAAMVALCLLAPRWRFLVIPLGLALIATRVITTSHYLSDTLFGIYVGATITVWIYRSFQQRGLILDVPTLKQGKNRFRNLG